MKLGFDSLAAHLARQLTHAYLVSGDEPLLVGEAADAIRQAARSAGFADRQVFFGERGFDWNELRSESASLSLFAERRILEVKLATGKPGEGAQVLQELVERPAPDTLLLVISGHIERPQQAAWVNAFERSGAWLPVWPIETGRLPGWIAARMKRHGLEPAPGAAEFLAERVEGNLLAAQQEIDKLALLIGKGRVEIATLEQAVATSARYDVFKLQDAAFRGDGTRALRILSGLRAEGEEPTLILWAINAGLRALLSSSRRLPLAPWPRPPAGLDDAVRRLRPGQIAGLIGEATLVDRTIKGRAEGDPWDALARLVARIAGVQGVPSMPRGRAA